MFLFIQKKYKYMKKLNLISYSLIFISIIIYLYYLSLSINFIYNDINICEEIKNEVVDNVINCINKDNTNNKINNNLGSINSFYLSIKNEIINMRNNFIELFNINNNKYTYYPSRVIKYKNTFSKFIIEDNEPVITCKCEEYYKPQLRLAYLEYNMVLQNIKSFLNKTD